MLGQACACLDRHVLMYLCMLRGVSWNQGTFRMEVTAFPGRQRGRTGLCGECGWGRPLRTSNNRKWHFLPPSQWAKQLEKWENERRGNSSQAPWAQADLSAISNLRFKGTLQPQAMDKRLRAERAERCPKFQSGAPCSSLANCVTVAKVLSSCGAQYSRLYNGTHGSGADFT